MPRHNFDLYRMSKAETLGRDGIATISNAKSGIVEIRRKCDVSNSEQMAPI